ncbi:fatty acid desaturase family protein [Alloalcanivorax marinus]|uniref:fatty acid desaturase family protein n=1 Tax=Alloalcanivorax marinus TaxID=1177169 RepID=UPI001933699F|nr:fatty acid desaturase [Alloalcanivorax marinus]MBL7250885.1 fatty acid desaturase [Alloalcanivorax marinus]
MTSSSGYQRQFGADDARAIRDAVKRDLGPEAFRPRPRRALWFLPMSALVVVGLAAILTLDLPWWGNLLTALLVGHTLGCQALLAHEVLHGALGLSRRTQNLLGWVGFGPLLVPPEFWRRWHNVAHHAHTNLGDQDPDSFGTEHRYRKHPKLANFTRLAPGSGTWYSYFFLFYSFVFHAQLVLWMQTRRRQEFRGFDRARAIRQSLACAAAWLLLAVVSGPLAPFTVLIPLMVANALGQGYILTNHMLRPQLDNNHPVDNSMSVRQWRWLDPLHFHFSHHVEHHLFPKLGSDQAPRVRTWLQREMPDRYVCPSHWRALVMLYRTPRVYRDAHTLIDPLRRERTVDVMALQSELR